MKLDNRGYVAEAVYGESEQSIETQSDTETCCDMSEHSAMSWSKACFVLDLAIFLGISASIFTYTILGYLALYTIYLPKESYSFPLLFTMAR